MDDSIRKSIYLPPEIVASIHSYFEVVPFDSVKERQIASFNFAAISPLYREIALAKGNSVIGLRESTAITMVTREFKEFVAILQGNEELVKGIQRLDIRCPNKAKVLLHC